MLEIRMKNTVKKRPVNLDLGSLKYPPMAIASILHRVSGVILFLLFPVMLYFLYISLQSPLAFTQLQRTLMQPVNKIVLWIFGSAIIYHLLAGIRHIWMDLGWGERLEVARRSASIVIAVAIFLALVLGVWIW